MDSGHRKTVLFRRSWVALACCLELSGCVEDDTGDDELEEEERAELDEEFRVQWVG